MDPIQFLEQVVRPNVEEQRNDISNLRKAINALAAVDSLAAHLFVWQIENSVEALQGIDDDVAYREQLSGRQSDFRLVRDVSKAIKHVRLTRGSPEVSSATQIQTRSLGWDEAHWGEGRWGSPPQVVVETNSGDLRVVNTIIENALAFLMKEMAEVGLVTN